MLNAFGLSSRTALHPRCRGHVPPQRDAPTTSTSVSPYLDSLPHKVLVQKSSDIVRIAAAAGRKLALVKSASVDGELKTAVPTMQIVFFDGYNAAFAALADGAVDGFLADKMLLLWFAQKSGETRRILL